MKKVNRSSLNPSAEQLCFLGHCAVKLLQSDSVGVGVHSRQFHTLPFTLSSIILEVHGSKCQPISPDQVQLSCSSLITGCCLSSCRQSVEVHAGAVFMGVLPGWRRKMNHREDDSGAQEQKSVVIHSCEK